MLACLKNVFPFLLYTLFATAQKENLPKFSAGFPINYEEDSVGTYTLPDVLKMNNGQPVKTYNVTGKGLDGAVAMDAPKPPAPIAEPAVKYELK